MVYVDRASIPFSFSQFSEPAENVQCYWRLTRLGVETTGNFSIPFGNYTIISLADQFVGGLRNSIENNTSPVYVPTINYVYDEINNRLTFYLGGTGSVIEILDEPYHRLNKALGFNGAWTLTASPILIGTTSNRDCSVAQSQCLYITSTSLSQSQNFSAIDTSIQLANMLTMIPITHSPLLHIIHAPSYVIKTPINNTIITEIQLTLRDVLLPEVYEMDLDWSIHLVIEEVRVEPYVSEMYRQLGDLILPQMSTEENLRRQALTELAITESNREELAQLREKLVENAQKLQERYEKSLLKRTAKKENKIPRKRKDKRNAPDDKKDT